MNTQQMRTLVATVGEFYFLSTGLAAAGKILGTAYVTKPVEGVTYTIYPPLKQYSIVRMEISDFKAMPSTKLKNRISNIEKSVDRATRAQGYMKLMLPVIHIPLASISKQEVNYGSSVKLAREKMDEIGKWYPPARRYSVVLGETTKSIKDPDVTYEYLSGMVKYVEKSIVAIEKYFIGADIELVNMKKEYYRKLGVI